MNKTQFDELLASVKEMDEIVTGRKEASRVFELPESEVKEVREKTAPAKALLR